MAQNKNPPYLSYDEGEPVTYGYQSPSPRPETVTYTNNNNNNKFNNGNANLDFNKGETVEYASKKANDQRFLEFLMLAALAGFFAALGSNFKHLFK